MTEDGQMAQRAGSLNVHAASFVPQTRALSAPPAQASTSGSSAVSTALEKRLPKLHTARSSLYKSLDQVPFTPTQGICTPSPTNMAAYWYQAHYGFADPFGMYASAWSPHQFLSQMSPGSPMHGSSSLASAASMFHMSQSSGSPNFSYPYSHWYWPHAPMSPQAAPLGTFMQTQYAASHTFSSGSPGSSNSSIGAGPNSPRSPVAVYSPTAAAAAAAAAGVHGHSLYSLSQTVAINQNMHPSYHYQHESMPGWQQGFIQGVGYGQPMRAYRSPSRTPSRSPPKGYVDPLPSSSQHTSDMQSGSSHHMSNSADSTQSPGRRSPLSRASQSQAQHPGRVPASPFGPYANSPPGATGSSPAGMLTSSHSAMQADATVSVRVQRSFLAAAKHGRTPSPQRRISPIVGKGSSPGAGLSMAYSASSEDGTSTSGLGMTDEAQSAEVLEELCGVCRGQGRWQEAPQQLTDLAELMQSYGFPTPGWTEEEGPGRADSHGDTDMIVRQGSSTAKLTSTGAALRIPSSAPHKLNARQRRTLRRAIDRARQAVAALVAQ
ncbi:TPA: hypothetical protein ACH3X3_010127 [Trebouxia sp. C0006]